MKTKQDLKSKLSYSVTNAESEFEICALCHAETTVKKSTPIDQREGYVSGIGQLCKKCFLKNLS